MIVGCRLFRKFATQTDYTHEENRITDFKFPISALI